MPDATKALKAGKLITFWEGEYCDRVCSGTYIALKDLSLAELIAKSETLRVGKHRDDLDGVAAMLIREGYLFAVDTTEVHLGAYRTLDIKIV